MQTSFLDRHSHTLDIRSHQIRRIRNPYSFTSYTLHLYYMLYKRMCMDDFIRIDIKVRLKPTPEGGKMPNFFI